MNYFPCPRCADLGQESACELRSRLRKRPEAQGEPESAFDGEGRYHYHDPNVKRVLFRCEHGHYWIETSQNGCGSCDHGHNARTAEDVTFNLTRETLDG